MANKLARIAWAVLTSGHVYSAEVCTEEKDGNRAAITTFPYVRLPLSLTTATKSFQPGLQADSLMAEHVHPTHLEP
jgi:hypothetical protein